MAKNRVKQREHLNYGMTREERLMKEEADRLRMQQEQKEEMLDLHDYCGIKDPTPYLAVRNIIRKERAQAITEARTKAKAAALAAAI